MLSVETTVPVGALEIAVKCWGEPGNSPVIALHGWQDNAATFDRLAPLLPEFYWVIPDLPGHGRSGHRGIGAEYSIWSYCVEVMALANVLELGTFSLIGHSMGGGIASLLAGLFPVQVERLLLLDVLGTITTPAQHSPAQLRHGIEQRISKPGRQAGIYPTREAAIAARAKKGVTEAAANMLGERGIAENAEGFYWGHDQRLSMKTLLSLSDEQMAAFLEAITCPVLLVTSKEAVQREEVIEKRAALVSDIRIENLAGGHHQHLDGDIAAVAALAREFLG